jgi:hypothetical protein
MLCKHATALKLKLHHFVIMSYAFFLIAIVGFLLTWPILRRFTHIWIQRPITASESMIAGTIAWIFLISILFWFCGIGLLLINCLSTYKIFQIGIFLFSFLFTGFIFHLINQSRYDLHLDDTQDFFKEAIQFRRSQQRRLDVISLTRQERRRNKRHSINDSESRQHERLQANLDKEKEQDKQLALLRQGIIVDMSEVWHIHTQTHSPHPVYENIQEVRIDPIKKRLSLSADFSELNQEQLKDETTILRLNRQLYDFFQSMNAEPWLKLYTPFFESYFLMCRATKIIPEGTELMYPFMKVGVLVSELRKLEGSYFNPRKLSEITTLAFNNGAPV